MLIQPEFRGLCWQEKFIIVSRWDIMKNSWTKKADDRGILNEILFEKAADFTYLVCGSSKAAFDIIVHS